MPTKTPKSASERLADAIGIIPKYLDQTGTEWRKCTPESRAAIFAAMGMDGSSEAGAETALRTLRQAERAELIAPVHVVEREDDTATRHVEARLGSPPNGEAHWELTLTLEDGESRTAEGRWPRGMHAELAIPWPSYPALGYHQLSLKVTIGGRERTGEQTLIIVPPRCVQPPEKLGKQRAFGVVANLYTVRSERNWGVGDFSDLRQLVLWMGDVGGAFVGVNPLHALANRGKDVSPYSPVSRIFRNPLYIDVENIPELHVAPRIAARIDHPEFEAELSALRENPEVQYEAVMALKMPVLEELHKVFVERERAAGSARSASYDEFVTTQEPELTRFATFSAIAESLENWHWREWPAELQNVHSEAVQRFQREHAERIDLHRWIQFELDRQLGEVASAARRAGLPIGLYQDLAIGTSPTGADSWSQPELFIQRASIGAPPDPYSASGQNWGLPPIDPVALRRDRYRYFIRLVRSGFRHAGALRIDHVMGLFRLFWIPEGLTGKEGAYVAYPSDDLLGILALESVRHDALVVGEDLGTVPKDVPPALERWGVLSSKVLYFEREKRGFRPAEKYAPLALATANTHDMATLAGFFAGRDIELRAQVGLIDGEEALKKAREEREQDKRALLVRLAKEGVLEDPEMPNDAANLRGAIHEFLCRTPAALVGLALDDLAGEMDAVNLPGVGPDKHPSWKRKMGMTIDDMRVSDAVRAALRCSERGAGRGARGAGRDASRGAGCPSMSNEQATRPAPRATRHLSATYRIQLNKQFTLNDARAIVPYLDRLGISHLYCSPILAARPGSTHGYDVIDPTRVNPEIGSIEDLRALAASLHERGMGMLLDIVPNHMGIGAMNPYWDDVLAHGMHSRYARWFDIDWAAADNKVVLPVLGDELDKIIERDEITLDVTEKTPRLRYGDHSWPIDPATMPDELQVVKLDPTSVADPSTVLRGAEGRQRLRRLLDAQHYRLMFWRRGPAEINYRRFFDINDLAALRQEDPEVFAATHEFVLGLVSEGVLDGLRIDHVDGLLDPLGYLERLRVEVERRVGGQQIPRRSAPRDDNGGTTFPIVVEKILSPGEKLRRGWPVQGTTGYEFLNDLEDVFLDPDGYASIERGYRSLRRLTSGNFSDVAHAGKVKILEGPLRADVNRLARLLRPLARGNQPEGLLAGGIVQFIAALPVYRTYVDGRSTKIGEEDAAVVARALDVAHERAGAEQTPTVDLVGGVVLGTADPSVASLPQDDRGVATDFIQRLQQTSGPATAKGVEDTALYVYVPLSSRNEVGGAPDRPLDDAVGRLHNGNAERACAWPLGLTCTNTHDTKRSADLRARLDVLSECAPEWQRCVARWRRLNQRHRTTVKGRLAPDTNTEYLLYQTLIGVWPSPRSGRRSDDLPDRGWLESARQRVEQYMLKAVKEAKIRTSWTEPDEAYESALKQFIAAILSGGEDSAFLGDIARFVARIAAAGHWNALARVVLQLTSPGVADTYQGDELWLFALVDPDNRRAVDYKRREELIGTVSSSGALRGLEPSDERLKLGVVQRLLNMRRERASLFTGGAYLPLQVQGSLAKHVVAFARTRESERAIVVAPRLMQSAAPKNSSRPQWEDTRILLPEPLRGGTFRSVLEDREIGFSEASTTLALGELLTEFSMAVLLSP